MKPSPHAEGPPDPARVATSSVDYAARPGQPDRHGEMTGAISFNMVLTMPAVTAWAIYIGPALFTDLWPTMLGAVLLALILPTAGLALARRLWVRFSRWADRT